jgi:Flp pilus assembly secretin CpaC
MGNLHARLNTIVWQQQVLLMYSRVLSLFVFLMIADCSAQAGFAQGQSKTETQGVVQATKIPTAPVTEVEIKELKASIAVDVLASRSKVFKTKQKINRVAVSDPSVADVVLMTENQFVVIGKNPGAICVTVWCEPNATTK